VAVTAFDRRLTRTIAIVAMCGWAFVAIAFFRSRDDAPITIAGAPRNAVTLSDYGFQPGGAQRGFLAGPGVYYLDRRLAAAPGAGLPPTVVAGFGVGLPSYAFGPSTYVLDMLGLGDAFTAHLRLAHRGVVAHEKPLPSPWVAARLTAPGPQLTAGDFALPAFFVARPIDDPTGTFSQRVADARRALDCGELRTFLDRIKEPLTVGRFLTNIGHSFGATTFRIPPEPADAVAAYC
jgi:hypothetical protein